MPIVPISGGGGGPSTPTTAIKNLQQGHELVYLSYTTMRLQRRSALNGKVYQDGTEITATNFDLNLSTNPLTIENNALVAATFYYIYYSVSGGAILIGETAPDDALGIYPATPNLVFVGSVILNWEKRLETKMSVCGINQVTTYRLDIGASSISSGAAGYSFQTSVGVANVKNTTVEAICKISGSYDSVANEIKTLLHTSSGDYNYAGETVELGNQKTTVYNEQKFYFSGFSLWGVGYSIYYKGSDILSIYGSGESSFTIIRFS